MKFKKLSVLGIALSSTMLIPTSVSASSYYSNSAYAKAISSAYSDVCVITSEQEPNNPDVKWADKASNYRSTHYDKNNVNSEVTGAAAHVDWKDVSGMPSNTSYGVASVGATLTPTQMVSVTKASTPHDTSWKNVAKRGDTMALGVTQSGNNTFIQGRIISKYGDQYDGQQPYNGSNCAGNVEKWTNNGSAKTTYGSSVKPVKSHTPNSTYYVNLKQPQKSNTGKTREIFKNYKVYKYDANGHTTYYKNSDYDAKGNETNTTVTEYRWNPVTQKSVPSKVTKYYKGSKTSTKVTPTTWTTSKTYSNVTGKAHKANGTYIKETRKKQTSNFGKTQDIRTDYVKGTYGSNGKTKTWENWDYNSAGKFTAKKLTKYDSKERVINNTNYKYKTPGNSKTAVHTYYKNTKYHTNGRVKSTSTYSYYANSNQASKNVWNEFYTNGKPKLYKDTYYKSNGKVKEVRQSKFNTSGKRTKSVKKY